MPVRFQKNLSIDCDQWRSGHWTKG